ncbi:MAG: DUF1489 domain-containing protein [Kordiimonadaceae bacterium]|jgi:hypothetical protein|nr:DUF1489 domain-containing protein [Kordiimonadaceae bacterium]MBT6033269.1 DUF1489 domain-containing protein [Kordiimonadaceae bacterium]
MTVHIIKLCVGIDSVEHLIESRKRDPRNKGKDYNFHITRYKPKRADEILAGGSLYWVIKGSVLVRQKVIGFEPVETDNGTKCMIKMDKEIHLTESHPRRPFQGWRYFENNAVPKDLPRGQKHSDIPIEMSSELKALGLI